MPEEAAILARSLFEVGLCLRQLHAEPNNRNALVYGWLNNSINEQVRLLKHAEKNDAIASAHERLESRRREIAKEFTQAASSLFANNLGEDGVELLGKTGSPRILSHVACFAARSVADAADAVFAIMGWSFPPTVKEHVAKIERVMG